MKLENFWIAFSILGIIAIIIPAATMGTDVSFDLNLFMFVVGIATLYSFGSGGRELRILKNFGNGSFAARSLGFFIGLASISSLEGQEAIDGTQYAAFSISLGTIIKLLSQILFNRLNLRANT